MCQARYWMAQMGARAASPVTALTEVLTAVRRHFSNTSIPGGELP